MKKIVILILFLFVSLFVVTNNSKVVFGCSQTSECAEGEYCTAQHNCRSTAGWPLDCSSDNDCQAGEYCTPSNTCHDVDVGGGGGGGGGGAPTATPVPTATPNPLSGGGTCPWSSPISVSTLPGSGAVQAQAEVIYPNNTQMLQSFYRGDQGYWRIVPVVNGNPVWGSAGAWSAPIASSTLPGSGTIQTRSDFIIGNGANLVQAVWRGDQGFTRTVPISGGVPVWSCSSPLPTATPAPTRPDYCKSASADRAVLNTDETLTLSSESNTPVNGFFYVTYNLDNLYGPSNPKPVCTGAGAVTTDCPNGGTPFIFTADETGLRQNGSTHITFGRLFITDKNTGQQLKNVQFNAYFSLNGGQWSWPRENCVAYTKMAVTAPTATPVPGCLKKIRGDADCDDNLTFRDYFYYVAKKSGAVLPPTVNVDFNASGAVDDADRTIIVNSLLGR